MCIRDSHVGHAPHRIVGFARDFRLPLRARIESQYAEVLAQRFELKTEHRCRHQPTRDENNGVLTVAGFEVMQAQTVTIGEKPAFDRRGQTGEAHRAAEQHCQKMAECHMRSLTQCTHCFLNCI